MRDSISAEAKQLHDEGRKAASNDDPVRALELFHRAHQLAPTWPYPPYDMAFTYLLADYLDEAESWYAHVDQLAPRGFFTAKTSLDTIRREKRGELFEGFSKAFALLEWEDDATRVAALRQITQRFPSFPPAWKALASLLDDDAERLHAIERGLDGTPDDDTYGMLVLNKSLIVSNRGDRAAARQLLEDLLRDPRCTQGVEVLAKATLGGQEPLPLG